MTKTKSQKLRKRVTTVTIKTPKKKVVMKRRGSYVPANGVPVRRMTTGNGSFSDWFKFVPRGIGGAAGFVNGGLNGAVSGWNAGAKVSQMLGTGNYRRTRGRGAYSDTPIDDTILATPVPAMHSGDESVTLRKIEYLGDVFTSSVAGAFNVTALDFNPGVMLYWGSKFASLFQQWKLNGAMVYFRSRSSSYAAATALGSVMICMNYNSHAAAFTSKQEMQETTGCVACAIDQNATCAIEAKDSVTMSPVKFVRIGAVPSGEDIHLYDLGKLQVATIGCPTASANVGELYIAYDITFLKPITKAGILTEGACKYVISPTSSSDWWTTVAPHASYGWNTIGLTLGAEAGGDHTFSFAAGLMGKYECTFWFHSSAKDINTNGCTNTYVNCAIDPMPSHFSTGIMMCPPAAVGNTNDYVISFIINITNPSSPASVTMAAGWNAFGTVTGLRITVHEIPASGVYAPVPEPCLQRQVAVTHYDNDSRLFVADDEKVEEPSATISPPIQTCPPNRKR